VCVCVRAYMCEVLLYTMRKGFSIGACLQKEGRWYESELIKMQCFTALDVMNTES